MDVGLVSSDFSPTSCWKSVIPLTIIHIQLLAIVSLMIAAHVTRWDGPSCRVIVFQWAPSWSPSDALGIWPADHVASVQCGGRTADQHVAINPLLSRAQTLCPEHSGNDVTPQREYATDHRFSAPEADRS